jgi:3-dehydroquinate synthase
VQPDTAIRVALGDRSYDIHAAPGLLSRAGSLVRPLLAGGRVFVVTDDVVAPLYLGRLEMSLRAAGIDSRHAVLPAGEATKCFARLEGLLDDMLAARCERSTAIVALGGGVIGDLAGFAASILLRGVPFLQIPTTLLSQVDSSVGGKTGVNTGRGKNLVGSFHQPRLVLADIDTLATLPPRQLKAGYAEVLKMGLIGDADLFAWLESNGVALLAGDAACRQRAVLASCGAKARIVAADERESDQRALLNLGHTFGHALEAEAGYDGLLLHGEAVGIGLLLAFDLSVRLGLCPPGDLARLTRHFADLALPAGLPRLPGGRRWSVERLMGHFAADKKVRDGRVTFVLGKGIGRCVLCSEVPPDILAGVLGDAICRGESGDVP